MIAPAWLFFLASYGSGLFGLWICIFAEESREAVLWLGVALTLAGWVATAAAIFWLCVHITGIGPAYLQ